MSDAGRSTEQELKTSQEAYPFQNKLRRIFGTVKGGLPPEQNTGPITRRVSGIPKPK